MGPSLNNWLVDALRQGSIACVDSLAQMGHGPSSMLDRVARAQDTGLLSGRSEPEVSSCSIWFWVHQAPIPDAAIRCWDNWLARELSALDGHAACLRLGSLFAQALSAALSSGQASPLMATWERMESMSMARDLAWGRRAMIQSLASLLPDYGDDASAILCALVDHAVLGPAEVGQWAGDRTGPWDAAAARALPGLLGTLLGIHPAPPADLALCLHDKVCQEMTRTMAAGPGAWELAGHGDRLLACQKVLTPFLPPDTAIPESLSDQIHSVLEAPGPWCSQAVSALHSMSLEAGLGTAPALAPRRARM